MTEILQLPARGQDGGVILPLKNMREAAQHFRACKLRGGIGLLLGNPGTAKTTAAEQAARSSPRVVYHYVREFEARPIPLFKALLRTLGSERRHRGNSYELFNIAAWRIKKELTPDNGLPPLLLIVDEAQRLPNKSIEGLRDLAHETFAAICLVSNPAFDDDLDRRGLPQFTSRIEPWSTLLYEHEDMVALCRHFGVAGAREIGMIEERAQMGGWLRYAAEVLGKARALADAGAKITMQEIELAIENTRQCIVPSICSGGQETIAVPARAGGGR